MHRRSALLSLIVITLSASPAAAQPYEDALRFGLGLDYGGLAGRGDGGAGGLRLSLGARVHEHVAIYWQGQALGGAFVETDRVLGVFRGWNAAMVEASYGIFQVAAGPSFDVGVTCSVATGQDGGLERCDAVVAPGLATRAGFRFGILALSGDLHVTFDEHLGPDVWVLAGLGIQLGDVASEPMRFPSTDPADREAREDAPMPEVDEAPPFEATQRPVIARTGPPPARAWGRWLDDPRDLFGTDADWAATPEPAAEVDAFEPARAPVVRRFSARDVRTRSAAPTPRPAEAPPEMPELADTLDAEASDDPIDGLEGY